LQFEAPCQEPGTARVYQDGAGLGGLEQCIESAPGRAAIYGIHARDTARLGDQAPGDVDGDPRG
jgi:hypothetical protein